MIEIPTLKLYAIKRPGHRDAQVIGKLVQLSPTTRVLFRDFDRKTAALRKLGDALGCDVRMIAKARADGAEYIDHVADGILYRLTLDDFETFAVEADHGEGLQLYVGIEYWSEKRPAPYRTQWIQGPIDVLPDKAWRLTAPAKAREPKKKRTKPEPPKLQEGLGL